MKCNSLLLNEKAMNFKNIMSEICVDIIMIHLFREKLNFFKIIIFKGILNYDYLVEYRSSV